MSAILVSSDLIIALDGAVTEFVDEVQTFGFEIQS
jgi:hypothetical protein